jgi:hypothetical protein
MHSGPVLFFVAYALSSTTSVTTEAGFHFSYNALSFPSLEVKINQLVIVPIY